MTGGLQKGIVNAGKQGLKLVRKQVNAVKEVTTRRVAYDKRFDAKDSGLDYKDVTFEKEFPYDGPYTTQNDEWNVVTFVVNWPGPVVAGKVNSAIVTVTTNGEVFPQDEIRITSENEDVQQEVAKFVKSAKVGPEQLKMTTKSDGVIVGFEYQTEEKTQFISLDVIHALKLKLKPIVDLPTCGVAIDGWRECGPYDVRRRG
tara:strand:+ start:308 stop:910 length:603 start_codon:yes stop_codon:yes gene_type:complete